MFQFIAILVSATWLVDNWPIVVAVLVVVVLLIAARISQKRAARAAYLALPVIYIGNKSTHVYHCPQCEKLNSLAAANAVYFRTVDEVRRYGYTPCNICKP